MIMVRTSERQSFLTCRQRWYWSWVERLRAPETDPKLEFGDFVHQALAAYYIPGRKRGPAPADTFQQLAQRREDVFPFMVWSEAEYQDAVELGVGMLERYVEHWREADKEYSIIASEQVFAVPIGRINNERVNYVGTIDGVWRHLPTKQIRFAEHKTATAIKKDALPMDEQVGAYWTFGPRWLRLKGLLKSGQRLDGILYNWLRKAVPNPDDHHDALGRKLNADGSISKRQPPPYFDRELTFRGSVEADRVRRRVMLELRDMQTARAEPAAHVYKNPGPQFMPNCKFCSFRDMCELHETGNDWEAYRAAAYETWEPYEAHELPERR